MPEGEQTIPYRLLALPPEERVVARFAGFSNHLPYGGGV